MPALNSCPQCNVALQAFYLRASDESEALEVDGCRRCGGQWFDAGELEKVLGQKLELKWSDARSTRLCARCRKPLKAWKTKAGLQVECCDGCRGTFLDGGELKALGAPEADAASRQAMVPPGEFQCLKCQQKFPITQGNAMGYGLVCRGCVPQSGEDPLSRFIPVNSQLTFAEEARYQSERNSNLGPVWVVLGLLDLFL